MDTINPVLLLLLRLLTTEVMIVFWTAIMLLDVLVAYRTKIYGVLIISGGILPVIIFYVYKLLNIWDTGVMAVLYSRIAYIALGISIACGLWQMYHIPRRTYKDGTGSSVV